MENNQTITPVVKKSNSKSAIWNEAKELIKKHKISKAAALALEELLAPKSGGGSSINPPKLDEDGLIVSAWCKYHECYELADKMVISDNKSKGYCRASSSKSNRLRKELREHEAKVINAMSSADFETAQKLAIEAKEMKRVLHLPESYDIINDWLEFEKSDKEN